MKFLCVLFICRLKDIKLDFKIRHLRFYIPLLLSNLRRNICISLENTSEESFVKRKRVERGEGWRKKNCIHSCRMKTDALNRVCYSNKADFFEFFGITRGG